VRSPLLPARDMEDWLPFRGDSSAEADGQLVYQNVTCKGNEKEDERNPTHNPPFGELWSRDGAASTARRGRRHGVRADVDAGTRKVRVIT
jgi:hypothetical protein